MKAAKTLAYDLALAVMVKGDDRFYLIDEKIWQRVGGRQLGLSLAEAKSRALAKIAIVLQECRAQQMNTPGEPHQFESDGKVRLLYMVEVDTLSASAQKWVLPTKVSVNRHGPQDDLFAKMEDIVQGRVDLRDILYHNS